mgnify:CR=1 FL=1
MSVKMAEFENSKGTFTYLIFDGELIFDVILFIGDDLGIQNSAMRGLKSLAGLSQSHRDDT